MTRPTSSKIQYALVLVALSVLCSTVMILTDFNPAVVAVTVLVLFIPGRIQGVIFSDHFRGRRLLAAARYAESIEHSEAFLRQLRDKPWKRHFIWCGWGTYSKSIEAMTLNNIGVAYMHLADLDESQMKLQASLKLDPMYPVPHHNLALLAYVRGEDEAAANCLAKAQDLGYSRTLIDRTVEKAQAILASIEGRGDP